MSSARAGRQGEKDRVTESKNRSRFLSAFGTQKLCAVGGRSARGRRTRANAPYSSGKIVLGVLLSARLMSLTQNGSLQMDHF